MLQPSMFPVSEYQRSILAALGTQGGLLVRDIAAKVPRQGDRCNARQHSGSISYELGMLQSADLVKPMDDKKPIVWTLTASGARHLNPQA